jgi:hypothetical protein
VSGELTGVTPFLVDGIVVGYAVGERLEDGTGVVTFLAKDES